MQRLKYVMNKFRELSTISGKNAKIQFIKDNKDDEYFIEMLRYRLNPFYTYKIQKFDTYQMLEPKTTYHDFVNMLETLIDSNINDKLKADVIKMLQHTDHEIVDILEGIITKSFNIGVDTSVNKALGYQLIPEFGCMLAAPLKENTEVPTEVICEMKLDGVRCIALVSKHKAQLFTRQGRLISFPAIEKELLLFANGDSLMLDGELTTEARTDISGRVNRNLKTGYVEGAERGITYTMFDVMSLETFETKGTSKKQKDRSEELQKRFLSHAGRDKHLALVESFQVPIKKAYEINNKYIEDGYEGVIIKDIDAIYHFKRNKAWLKLKAVNQCTLKCINTELGKGKRKGKVGALLCETSCGKLKVKVGSGLSDEEVELFTKESPVCKMVEVTFNVVIKGDDSEFYSLFLPRFTSGAVLRVDKDEADSLAKILDEHIGRPEVCLDPVGVPTQTV